MYCLLCHEKIPRLRAWRTKSEFCCDEHAALYKKQTLERLLVDPAATPNGQSSLPDPPEPEEFELEELQPVGSQEAISAEAPESVQWESLEFPDELEENSPDLPMPAEIEQSDGIDELWKLASEIGDRRGPSGRFSMAEQHEGPSDVSRQSAEEALEALRSLASKSAARREEPPPDPAPPTFAMPPAAESSADDDFDDAAALREIRDLDGAPEPDLAPAFEPEPEPYRGRTDQDDVEDASILEQLMAEPVKPRRRRPTPQASVKNESAEDAREPIAPAAELRHNIVDEPVVPEPDLQEIVAAVPGEAAEALQELVGELKSGPQAAALDLDAPEPAWDFDDAANELAALDESLSTTGSPAMPYEAGAVLEVDIAPEDPAWETLDALDLVEGDIEPPEPELEDALPAEEAAKLAAAPVEDREVAAPGGAAAKAGLNGIASGDRSSHVRRGPSTRFRAVTTFAEIRLEPAAWPGAERIAAHGQRVAAASESEPAAPGFHLFLPAGFAAQGPGAWSMHEDSVVIEPEAALETSRLAESGLAITAASTPFEPGGLFFDVALSGGIGRPPAESDADADEAGVSAGRSNRS